MKGRLILVLVAAGLWTAAVGVRLYALQVVGHEEYLARAARQQRLVVELEPPRGAFYDARGRELAVSVEVDSAWADPRQVADPAAAARAIAEVVGGDPAALAARLAEDREFVWVARQLDRGDAERLASLALSGVGFLKEYKRYYPMGQLAAQVLGYAGIDQQGLAGLEHAADELVAGRQGTKTLRRDARRGTAASPLFGGSEPRPGSSLHLTLDATIQHLAERALAEGVESSGAESGSLVLLDPRNGAVLAMASYPTVDLNRFPESSPGTWRNRAILDAYEPGSTFKMVTAAAALEANRVDPSDVFDCEMGGITLAGVRIRDHKPFGRLTLTEVIARSSNVGAIKVGLAAGEERLAAAISAFGFGRPTGVELPGESGGEVRPVERWWPLTKAYFSFGQGLTVTPLQLANSFAAVANGGTLWRPRVIAAVESPEGEVRVAPAEALGRPVSAATARQLERMIEAVVAGGTGRRAGIAGYRVAGKTGTAQKADPGGGGYSATRFVASFVGFAPARDPRLVGVVVLDEPWPRYHGGEVAAPVFAAAVEPALVYLGVPPSAPDEPEAPDGLDAPVPDEPRFEGPEVALPVLARAELELPPAGGA
ncbi:MAG TPA: penicillin-binding protein 2, partial [Thermoanaerobaculia bacterium]|nr:penicillin-binding protein 2 [Thermoanaerobaculia bacterium]